MNVRFLFASPEGGIPVDPIHLKRPFLISPGRNHPFLTLEDYFKSIQFFLLRERAGPLVSILVDKMKRKVTLKDIREIRIRSEKHGAYYHIAGIEITVHDQEIALAVCTAVSDTGRIRLTREYEILVYLSRFWDRIYLPRVYFMENMDVPAAENRHESLSMLLVQWFEGFHEWHVSIDREDGLQKVCLWDMKNSHQYIPRSEAFEIFRQAAKILTLYYDPVCFNQIYPWHHGAGDFIVRIVDGCVDVRLTTARQYGSIMDFFSDGPVHPIIALVYFFLNLTVRMRLDKLDGIGKTVWVDDFSVPAVLTGFFDAVGVMDKKGRYVPGKPEDLLVLLRSFGLAEWERLLGSLPGLYQKDDPDDVGAIQTHLKDHARCLHREIQAFRL